MFRTLCAECAALVEAKAMECTNEKDVFILGCSHNRVAASVLVNGGMIVGWNLWPVTDEETFRDRAVIQMTLLHEFMGLGNDKGQDGGIVKH